jgi:hypothetical protein
MEDIRDQFSMMIKNEVRVSSPLNNSPMSTNSFLAIVTANFDCL